ncbi:hypothetical protein [Caulobacter segnis]
MRHVAIAAMGLCLAGCGKLAPCAVAENVRVDVQGHPFTFPVDLKPTIFDTQGKMLLRAHERRAYCQKPTDPAPRAYSVSFYPAVPDVPEVSFMIIGRSGAPVRPRTLGFPTEMESGFEVTRTKGPVLVFSPAGGIRGAPIKGDCMEAPPSRFTTCRISLVTRRGVGVTFDLRGQSPDKWPAILSKVDAFVDHFETAN